MSGDQEDTRSWPIGLRRIAAVIGASLTLKLVENFGGTEGHYLPRLPTQRHPFAAVIGYDDLRKLCDALGPCSMYIPRGVHRNPKKLQILENDGPAREVARELGVSERYVQQVRKNFSITREGTG